MTGSVALFRFIFGTKQAQRTWLLQEFIHPNSLEQETFHPEAKKQDASNTEGRNASKFLFKLTRCISS
jgi:hypothetical protein